MTSDEQLLELARDLVARLVVQCRRAERLAREHENALGRLQAVRQYIASMEPSAEAGELLALLGEPAARVSV